MKKKSLVAVGMITLCLFTGCQSKSESTETEALKEQIAQLEQRVDDLQQELDADASSERMSTMAPKEQYAISQNAISAQTDSPTDTKSVEQNSAVPTIEELTALVDAYVEKINALPSNGTDAENMEQFLALKQEEKQIDNQLDLHEDELERLYQSNALTREEYKKQERELEQLEDRLDGAKDQLEFIFGIDD